jgi:serine/threonine-protein kinase HipA
MNGSPVGWLSRRANGIISFRYDAAWLASGNTRPLSLSLPLISRTYSGDRVENFFDNLLPDSIPLRNRLQARTGAASPSAFDLLFHIGRDCVGAIQLVPEGESVDVRKITANRVDDEQVEAILHSHAAMPLGVDLDSDFRLSVAGVQEKTAFLEMQGAWYRPFGATPTSHIFKLPMGRLGQSGLDLSESVENEWLCQQLLEAFGMPVARTSIATFGSQKVLVVRRFDRRWAGDNSWLIRLPQEDLCQATGTPGALKYEADGGPGMRAAMDLLLGSERAYEDRKMFMMAMAVLGKNRHYRWNTITRRHWLDTARKCRFAEQEMETIIEKCCDLTTGCVEKAGAALPGGFPEHVAESIFSGLQQARDRLTLAG